MIARGTTPNLSFIFNLNFDMCEQIIITIRQGTENIIEISKDRLEYINHTLYLKLSQAETLKLYENVACLIQLKVKMVDGTVMASNIVGCEVYQILNEVIL